METSHQDEIVGVYLLIINLCENIRVFNHFSCTLLLAKCLSVEKKKRRHKLASLQELIHGLVRTICHVEQFNKFSSSPTFIYKLPYFCLLPLPVRVINKMIFRSRTTFIQNSCRHSIDRFWFFLNKSH